MTHVLTKTPASTAYEANGSSAVVYFIPKVPLGTTQPKFGGALCTLQNTAAIPVVPQYEAEVMGIGKTKVNVRSKEIKIDPFEIEIQADFKTLQILAGQTPFSTTNNARAVRGDYGITGHLMFEFFAANDPTSHLGSVLILNVETTLPELPALAPDSSVRLKVRFQSAAGRVFYTQPGIAMSVEGWKSPNTAAPNGTTNTVFTLGEGNGAYASSTSPVALTVESEDATRTGYTTHFLFLAHNGVEVPASSASYATGDITFTTAPAAGSLLAIYLVDTSVTDTTNMDQPSRNDSLKTPWQNSIA